MTEHRLAPNFSLISSHLPTYGRGFEGVRVIATCACGAEANSDGYGGWWAWHLAHALDQADSPAARADEPRPRTWGAGDTIPPDVRLVADENGCIYEATDDPDEWRHAAHGDGALAGAPISTGHLLACGVTEALPAEDEADIERAGYAMYLVDYATGPASRGSKAFGIEDYRRNVVGLRTDYDRRARAALAALKAGQP